MPAPERLDLDQLHRDGWCTVRLLDASEVAHLAARHERLPIRADDAIWASSVDGDRPTARAEDQAIKAAMAAALARVSPGSQPFLAAFITKPAGGGLVDIHQDWTYVDERVHRSRLFWCPLVDVDGESGTLWVVPGSHRWSTAIRGSGAIAGLGDDVQDALWAAAQPVPLAAGEAIVYDAALLHGSKPTNGRARPVAAIATNPTGAQLLHAHRASAEAPIEVFAIDEAWFTTAAFAQRPAGYDTVPPWAEPTAPLRPDEVAGHAPARRRRWLPGRGRREPAGSAR